MPALAECLHRFLQVDRSPYTNSSYATALTPLVTAVGPGRDIALISYADLVDYFARLRATIKPASARQYLTIAKVFFNWCVRLDYIPISPAQNIKLRSPPADPTRSRAIPADVLERMVDLCRHRPRDLAILLFLADTACRVGGLASLTLNRLNVNEGTAMLKEKGSRFVAVYFSAYTADALRDWLDHRPACRHEFVFTRIIGQPEPLTVIGVSEVVRTAAKEVCGREYGPHSIRHLVTNEWANAGVPVTVLQMKLGHKDPKTTLHYYPKDTESVRRASHEHSLVTKKLARDSDEPSDKIIRFEDYAG